MNKVYSVLKKTIISSSVCWMYVMVENWLIFIAFIGAFPVEQPNLFLFSWFVSTTILREFPVTVAKLV
jgi:hypothetical protein